MFIIAIPGGRVMWIVGPSQHVTFLTMELFYKHPFPSYILPWGPLNGWKDQPSLCTRSWFYPLAGQNLVSIWLKGKDQNSVSIWLRGKDWKSERCSKEKCEAFGGLCIPQIHQIAPRIPAMFVFYILFCSLHFPSFSPQSPILHHFLRHVSRLSSWGRGVYLPTGKLTPGSTNIAPATTSSCPEGGTKCQTMS